MYSFQDQASLYFEVCRSSYYARVYHVGVHAVVFICGANRSRTLSCFLQKKDLPLRLKN